MLKNINKFVIFILILFFSSKSWAGEKSPSEYVSNRIWNEVKNYMIPADHPAKKKLDEICSRSRAIFDINSMKSAGFSPVIPQHNTCTIVTRHPELAGYIMKIYLDEQPYFKDRPEYFYWIERIIGANKIRKFINDHHYQHLFKVPNKWIYLVPDEPSPPADCLRKNFILVEDDMEIFRKKISKEIWKSDKVTHELLDSFFHIVTKLGLYDSAKPGNSSFSKDGRVAFIDTQVYWKKKKGQKFIIYKEEKYRQLLRHLNDSNKLYWENLIIKGRPIKNAER